MKGKVIIKKEKLKVGTNHERVPGHGGEVLIEQLSSMQLIYHPIVAVTVDNRLIEVENHHDVSHFYEQIKLAGN